MDSINSVIHKLFCTGCGFCVPVCPTDAIQIYRTPAGIASARVNENLCNGCGECLKICPGIHCIDTNRSNDPFVGIVRQSFCAWTTDFTNRPRVQSGGIVSQILYHLFKSEQINGAIAVSQKGLNIIPYWIKSANDIEKTFGSKYIMAPIGQKFPKKFDPGDKIAIVGLGCQIRGLSNILQKNKNWQQAVKLKIGLFCDRVLSDYSQDWLIQLSGLSPEKVKSFEFRSKIPNGWPGDVRITPVKGHPIIIDKKERMKIKDILTPVHCRLCFDKLNISSDIACGDSYNLSDSKNGKSSVLIRTALGEKIFNEIIQQNHINFQKVPLEKILSGQGIEYKKEIWSRLSDSWFCNENALPDFGIQLTFKGNKNSDQLMAQSKFLATADSKKTIFDVIKQSEKNKLSSGIISKLKKYIKYNHV